MRVLSSDKHMVEMSVNEGAPRKIDKDGTFHVPEHLGKILAKSGDFAQVGVNFRSASQSFECPDCGRENVIKDSCGCGWKA
jgi:hypothetical protein